MPEISAAFIAFFAGSVAVAAVVGWITRGNRCAQEKIAVNDGWQQQLEAHRTEHTRLLEQNRALMEQISQLQASGKDGTNRARELSDALKEAFERRDQLQRKLKNIRSSLERALRQREELQSAVESSERRNDSIRAALQEKDDKIFRLSRELENWQNRLPPLIERYRERDNEARQVEEALAAARARIDEFEQIESAGETRIEPVGKDTLGDELDASNDPANVTYTGLEEMLQEADDLPEYATPDKAEDDVAEFDDEAHAGANAEVTELHDREPGGLRDNLRLIKGIGPAIEKTLNELGIFRYHQIAEMTEYDIDRVAQRLKGFSSRIYREDWIGQARDLQLKKSGT